MLDTADAALAVDKSTTLILPLSSRYIEHTFDFCKITEKTSEMLR